MKTVARLFFLFILCSCARLSEPEDELRMTRVQLCPLLEQKAKSSLSCADDALSSYVLMAYSRGSLEASVCSEDASERELLLVQGRSYRLYAVANVPTFIPPTQESELLAYTIPNTGFQSGLPMVWQSDELVLHQSSLRLSLAFERLYARLTLHLDKGLMSAWKLTQVRLCQVAASLRPFWAGQAAEAVQEGDCATEQDLYALNQGESLCLYVPENVQGTLLPAYANSLSRIPENLGDRAGLCTYLELDGVFEASSGLSGSSCVRVYLGQNSADDFSIYRNQNLELSLYLSENLLSGVAWKIESHATLSEGSVLSWVESGMHSMDELYKGECFRYAIRPIGPLRAFMEENIEKCSLRCSSLVDSALVFSPFRSFHTDGAGTWYVEGLCRACTSDGKVQLWMNDRNMLTLEEKVQVLLPELVIRGDSCCQINAPNPSCFTVDFLDNLGRSLSEAYAFEPLVYDISCALQSESQGTCPSAFVLSVNGTSLPSSGASALHLSPGDCLGVRISHDGRDDSLNRFLTESLEAEKEFSLCLEERQSGKACACFFKTEIAPIRLLLFDQASPNNYAERLADADIASRSSMGRYFPIIKGLQGCVYSSSVLFPEPEKIGDYWALGVHNPSLLPFELGLVLAAPSGGEQIPQAALDGYLPKKICALMYEDQRFKVVNREWLSLDRNLLQRAELECQYLSDSTWVLPLKLGKGSVERHLMHYGDACGQKYLGLVTSLYYAPKSDSRLDDKVEFFYNGSDASVNIFQFSSTRLRWISRQNLPNPTWLRYAHYDSVHDLCFTIQSTGQQLMASCSTSTADLNFDMRVQGDLTASLFLYPDGTLWNGYWYVEHAGFAHTLDALPADGQSYPMPGNYWQQMDYLYSIAPMDDNTILGTNHYAHHLYPERSTYTVTVGLRGDVGLVVPRYECNLNTTYYHEQDQKIVYVPALCEAVAGEEFYLYDM